ncbi:hypothetical protein ACEQUB_00994 [Ralstonia syzygii]
MHGHTGRLVDHQQVGIFVENREFGGRHGTRCFSLLGRLLRDAQRRNAHQIAELQAVFRVDAALVHAYLAGAQDAVDVALGHALGQAHQEVVDPLPLRVFANFNVGDRFAVECFAHRLLNAAIKWMA